MSFFLKRHCTLFILNPPEDDLELFLSENFTLLCRISNLNLTLLHSERPKLHTILPFLSVIGLKV